MRPGRRHVVGVVSWLFGLATTVTLISTWGRAVSADPAALVDVARPLATATVVVDRFEDLAAQAVASGLGLDPATSRALVDGAFEEVDADGVLAGLLSDMVIAASSPEPTVIDVGARLIPLVDTITRRLAEAGIQVEPAKVEASLRSLEPVVIEGGSVGSNSQAARGFTVASLLGLLGMVVTGGTLIAMSDRKVAEARALLSRVAVSAFTFAVLLRLGSWLSDPRGGRTPVRSALSTLLAQKTWIPLLVAAVALSISGTWGWMRRRRKAVPSPEERIPAGVG
jgi:ribosomal protein L12E/L44/L45/RPP1/RPP2